MRPRAWITILYDNRLGLGFVAALAAALAVILAGVHHVDRDRATFDALVDARYAIAQQAAIIELAQRDAGTGTMTVKLATIPPSDIAYDLVAVPTIQRGR